jgi:hypothetical protein
MEIFRFMEPQVKSISTFLASPINLAMSIFYTIVNFLDTAAYSLSYPIQLNTDLFSKYIQMFHSIGRRTASDTAIRVFNGVSLQ